MHQEGSSLTAIPSDQELGDAVLKELGLRRKLGTSQDEVCAIITNNICKNKQTKFEIYIQHCYIHGVAIGPLLKRQHNLIFTELVFFYATDVSVACVSCVYHGVCKIGIFFHSFNKTNSLNPITYCVHKYISKSALKKRVLKKLYRQPFLIFIQRYTVASLVIK